MRRSVGASLAVLIMAATLAVLSSAAPAEACTPAPLPAPKIVKTPSSLTVNAVLRVPAGTDISALLPVPEGRAEAQSPAWHNDANGRDYYYRGAVWVNHTYSEPCTGADEYGYGFNWTCWRYYGPTNDWATNPCNFEVYAALQKNAGFGWSASWGYKYFHILNQRGCYDEGTGHLIPDGTGAVRTITQGRVRFLSEAGAGLHLSAWRRTYSYEITTGNNPTLTATSCTGKFCDPVSNSVFDTDGKTYAC